jgi:2,4-dienoyl-CoA reductase-like NADH-dependent reductase (Old Yellow Enzyme family)
VQLTLFEPVTLRGLTIRNRIMMSPMSQRAADEDGCATDWHLVHYGSRAVGGCGLVMIEDTAVAPLGRTGSAALGLYDRKQADRMRPIVTFCKAQGAAVGLQLAHAGRKALVEERGVEGIVSSSPLSYAPGWVTPREVDEADLEEIVDTFAAASALALEVGIDAIEIHAAHGYLLHQFLSPLTNAREDGYGGEAGRPRLLLEVVAAVRERWPAERPLFVRLPAGDGAPGGFGVDELVAVARACGQAGADLIDLTGGTPLPRGAGVTGEQIFTAAQALLSSAEVAIALGGGVVDGVEAESLIEDRGATLVSVGRPLLDDPHWPMHVARALEATPPGSLQSVYASSAERSSP